MQIIEELNKRGFEFNGDMIMIKDDYAIYLNPNTEYNNVEDLSLKIQNCIDYANSETIELDETIELEQYAIEEERELSFYFN